MEALVAEAGRASGRADPRATRPAAEEDHTFLRPSRSTGEDWAGMAGRRYETPTTSPSAIAVHASTRTTQLYNKLPEEISLHEIECIHI